MPIRIFPFLCLPAVLVGAAPHAAMDALLGRYFKADLPGAVVLVQKGGKVVFRKAYGLASLESKTPMQPDQVFRIASVTKTFTAAAVLRLAEEGKVELSTSIHNYLPDLPEAWGPVTVAHLLSNTSGIPNYTDDPAWWPRQGEDLSPAILLETYVRPKPLEFEPGTDWHYSNSGYLLLGQLIEAVSGQDYESALRTRFFGPFKLERTRYGWDAPPIPGLAVGYLADGRPAPRVDKGQLFSTAGLVSTVDDLGTWLRALTTGQAVAPASFRKMAESWKFPDGRLAGYGFGLYLRPSQGHRLAGHGGQILGYTGFVEADLDADVQVVLLTNRFPPVVAPEYLTRRLLALAIGRALAEPKPVALDPGKLARLTGQYKGRRLFRVSFAEGRLWVLKGPDRAELVPLSDTEFQEKDSDRKFRFTLSRGTSIGLRLQVLGAPATPMLLRIGEEMEPAVVQLDPAQLDACAGIYEPAPGVRVRYRRDGLRFFCDDPDEGPIELVATGPDRFQVKGSRISVEFHRNPEGSVTEVVTFLDERRVAARRVE